MTLMHDCLAFYHCPLQSGHPAQYNLNIPKSLGPIFSDIATLIDLPDDGRLFDKTESIVRLLISAWEKESNNSLAGSYNAIEQIFSLDIPIVEPQSTWGVRASNPVFSFLMFQYGLTDELKLTNEYSALTPFLLKRINLCHAKVENATDQYRYHLSLASRKLVAAAPTLPPAARFDWDFESRLSITKSATEALVGNTDLTTMHEWAYIADLLFRDRTKLGRMGGGTTKERKSRWLLFEREPTTLIVSQQISFCTEGEDIGGSEGGFNTPEEGRVASAVYMHPQITPAVLAEMGEFESDYIDDKATVLPASWFTDPWLAKRKTRGKQEAMLASDRVNPWDRRVISLANVRRLIGFITSTYGEKGCAILSMAMLAGINEQSMKRLKIGSFVDSVDPNEKVTEELMRGDRFYDPRRQQLWWVNTMGTEDESRFLKVPLVIRIKLPKTITRHLLSNLSQGSPVFEARDFTSAKKTLLSLGDDGLGPISFCRLCQTFEAYFVHGGGLPDIAADLIQGKSRAHLISQHYYVTVPWTHTIHEWRRMIAMLLKCNGDDVSKLLRQMAYHQSVRQTVQLKATFSGAIKTPTSQALKAHAFGLLNAFPRDSLSLEQASPEEWNAYVAYLYFLMAVSTGRRPQRDPFPLLSDFDLVKGTVFIEDKWNRKFQESRVISLCETLHRAMKGHQKIHNMHFMRWKLAGYLSNVSIDQLFMIDKRNKSMIPVSPIHLDQLCVGIKGYFVNLRNGPRHYLLTRLHHVGVAQETIDFLSGHRHTSREPEMSASLVNWQRTSTMLKEIIERDVVEFLGLETPFVTG